MSSTVLTLKNIGVPDVIAFDYLDKPDQEQLERALKALRYLEAIDQDGELTSLGVEMS